MINKLNPRIIAGEFKNKKLLVPFDSRPVTDRVKKTIFDILGDYVENSLVVDLFAGAGSFGCEALSRGASITYFMDSSEDAIQTIKENLANLAIDSDRFKVIKTDFDNFIRKNKGLDADLVFVDPPFFMCEDFPVFKLLRILKNGGVAVFKLPSEIRDPHIPNSFEILKDKEIGINRVLILQKNTKKD